MKDILNMLLVPAIRFSTFEPGCKVGEKVPNNDWPAELDY